MADVFYAIMFSPPAFGRCNEGNTFIDAVQINGRSQLADEVEALRLTGNPCAFLNGDGFDIGLAGTTVEVIIKAHVDTAAVGNRTLSFFMCGGGRQYNGLVESEGNDPNGQITLEATYTIGPKVTGDCVTFLRSKLGVGAAAGATVSGAAPGLMPMTATESLVETKQSSPPVNPETGGRSDKKRTKQIIKRIVEP